MRAPPVTLSELAGMLGRDRHWPTQRGRDGRRNIDALIERDGLPAPVTTRGRMRFDRRSVEAWLARHHPLAPRMPAPANDCAPYLEGDDPAATRRRMQEAYGAPSKPRREAPGESPARPQEAAR